MNQVQVTGRLVKDPEVRQLPDGRAVCTVRLAVEGMGRGNEVGFLDVTEFGPAAAASGRTLTKGWLVAASGRLDFREWDGKDSQRRTAIGLVGRIEFLAAPRTQQAPSPAPVERAPEPAAELPQPAPQYGGAPSGEPVAVGQAVGF